MRSHIVGLNISSILLLSVIVSHKLVHNVTSQTLDLLCFMYVSIW